MGQWGDLLDMSILPICPFYPIPLKGTQIKTHKGDEKWPLFVNKQLFWWSVSITLDNNNAVLPYF